MRFIKRHLWLVIVLGVMAVLSITALVGMFIFNSKTARREKVLVDSLKAVSTMKSAGLYQENAGKYLQESAQRRRAQVAAIEKQICQPKLWVPLPLNAGKSDGIVPFKLVGPGDDGQQRQLLRDADGKFYYTEAGVARYVDASKVTEVVPSNTEIESFRYHYINTALPKLKSIFNGAYWVPAARDQADPNYDSAAVYVVPGAFHVERWISDLKPLDEKDVLRLLRESQDNLWLLEDVAEAIRRTNESFFDKVGVLPDERKSPRFAVIKELRKIDIGAQAVGLGRGASDGDGARYLFVEAPAQGSEAKATEVKALTLTGRATDNSKGRYWVLPFRVEVIADAGNAHELISQLSGSRSFITVLDVNREIVPDTEEKYKNWLLRPDWKARHRIYGDRALVKLTLTCESLVFMLDNARPTTPLKTAAAK
jgi:hypothetical protein